MITRLINGRYYEIGPDVDLHSADLHSADLPLVNLSGANLSGANLVGANLSTTNLSGSNLSGANLTGANLRSADLQYANLQNSNLQAADLRITDFRNADLRNADLRNANVISANFRNADVRGTLYDLRETGEEVRIVRGEGRMNGYIIVLESTPVDNTRIILPSRPPPLPPPPPSHPRRPQINRQEPGIEFITENVYSPGVQHVEDYPMGESLVDYVPDTDMDKNIKKQLLNIYKNTKLTKTEKQILDKLKTLFLTDEEIHEFLGKILEDPNMDISTYKGLLPIEEYHLARMRSEEEIVKEQQFAEKYNEFLKFLRNFFYGHAFSRKRSRKTTIKTKRKITRKTRKGSKKRSKKVSKKIL